MFERVGWMDLELFFRCASWWDVSCASLWVLVFLALGSVLGAVDGAGVGN